ncbi:MAG TPA: sugar-transfer associated ATP-grasp domain-containing protein [Frateuria sp.]|uniref:sugar-transfer associated ATP-grasp domain-containing protein n=1 Tax=Frateuria sp. TaxID=2211372 RepID=UPI002D7F7B4F|nr:sugar-transfer associated ATP-grasp domain-containing protein [Frateuria sp.]HET6805262.1 sugar-transfer associated ATP-grasp domain-containing protein [Frateuria sp.]
MPTSTQSLKKASLGAVRRLYTGLQQKQRQAHYNHQAQTVLKVVEGQRGPTARTALRQADEYARDVLGSSDYAPWLYVYAAVSGGFREGWIPDNYYGMVVDPHKSGEVAKVGLVKSFTNRILNTAALPDLAYVIDGVYYARDYRPLSPSGLTELLFARDECTVFKADNSYQGRSVTFMTREHFPAQGRLPLPDGVFQSPIRQHGFFAALSPSATATLRITTAREPDGSISVRAAYLRLGRDGDDIVRSSSHVRVAVDPASGALEETGYLHDWRRTDTHPDTGLGFAGLVVPQFDKALQLCRSLHESCPHMPCLGWDLCIDQDNQPRLMEWNARYNDIKFSEATKGPCFRGLGWENLWRDAAA